MGWLCSLCSKQSIGQPRPNNLPWERNQSRKAHATLPASSIGTGLTDPAARPPVTSTHKPTHHNTKAELEVDQPSGTLALRLPTLLNNNTQSSRLGKKTTT